MKEINQLLGEYKVLVELTAEAQLAGNKQQAITNAQGRINAITRQLWNLGINQAQIDRLVNA